jgi:uncharacterized repeat protein (TIGR03803 family)
VIQGTDGNLYGVSWLGGANNDGTVFKFAPSGGLTTLHSFSFADGDEPIAVLVEHTNGQLYGITEFGGLGGSCSDGCGTAFSTAVGLKPFVRLLPTSGKVGTTVKILGNNLLLATSVTFNGTPATFTVSKTGTFIETAVPAGATTGPIQVVTPSRTLASNVNFQVLP